ncbi:MAG: HNH endonuclease [Evtepia sp.]|nr:HNH endonuclease [Evtepia sp.]
MDRTDALSIPREVKLRVAKRDSVDGWPCCILCGRPVPTSNPLAFSNAHYISRAQGGLGIEKNILTLCWGCHKAYDGTERNTLRPILRRYLREHYDDWNEEDLIYKKEG